jgi:cytosine/creatinine deaminase
MSAQMTGQDAMRACFDAVTRNPAALLGLEGYGLEVGCYADWCCSRRMTEAPHQAARLKVIRRGRVIAEADPRPSRAHRPSRAAI